MSNIGEKIFTSNDAEQVDLNMAPFLGLMAVLVPMLLLTAAFVKLTSVNAKVPVLAEAQAAIDKQKKDNEKKKLGVHVLMSKDKTVVIQVREGQKVVSQNRVPADIEMKLDLAKLQDEFVNLKKKNPAIFKARMHPTETVKYVDIVEVMDVMRVAPGETQFPVTDLETGKVFQTNLMFDDITFGNIMGDE